VTALEFTNAEKNITTTSALRAKTKATVLGNMWLPLEAPISPEPVVELQSTGLRGIS